MSDVNQEPADGYAPPRDDARGRLPIYAALCDQLERLRADNAALREALAACEVSMDTAAICGVGDLLNAAGREAWKRAHMRAMALLAKSEGKS